MKTMNEPVEVKVEGGKRFIAFICNKIDILLSSSTRFLPRFESNKEEAIDIDREGQFAAFVHNRISILVMWIQRRTQRDITENKRHLQFFLHDMEHHFVDPHVEKRLRDAFRWIRVYIKIYPDVFKKDRKEKAYEMIRRIYEAIGIKCRL